MRGFTRTLNQCHSVPGTLTVYGPVALLDLEPLWTTTFQDPENTPGELIGVDMSRDGNTIAVTTYQTTHVYHYGNDVPLAVMARGGFDFHAHLHKWDGDGYEPVWSSDVGHPWVTSVAVADDGTVMAGTFEYRDGNSGKVVALDADDGAMLWECLCYAEYVAEVDITPDRTRAVAVSWGDTDLEESTGDVFTAFDVATGEVLFRLLSGVDEPGSLFSVSIRDDGTTCSPAARRCMRGFSATAGRSMPSSWTGRWSEPHSVAFMSVEGFRGPALPQAHLLPHIPPYRVHMSFRDHDRARPHRKML